MNKILLISTTLLLLQGCASLDANRYSRYSRTENTHVQNTQPTQKKDADRREDEDYLYYYIAHSFSQTGGGKYDPQGYKEKTGFDTDSNGYGHIYSFNGEKSLILSEIVSKMADQLLYGFPKEYRYDTIALTSIVDLNDHSVTNWLGQTVSEQFIHELNIRQLRVVDFKLTGNIQLTKTGEFAITRDWKKLNRSLNVDRILTGTMSRNEEGVIFNVRIVNALTNIVEATTSAFVPNSMFIGGEYDHQIKRYYSRDSRIIAQKNQQVQLVK